MTRKDFELLADIVASLPPATGGESLEDFGPYLVDKNLLVTALADALATTNPRFNRNCFVSACH